MRSHVGRIKGDYVGRGMLLRILCMYRRTNYRCEAVRQKKNHDGPLWLDDPLLAVLVLYWKMSCNRDSLSSGTTDEVTLARRGDNGVSERTGEVGTGEVELRLFDSSSVVLYVRTCIHRIPPKLTV